MFGMKSKLQLDTCHCRHGLHKASDAWQFYIISKIEFLHGQVHFRYKTVFSETSRKMSETTFRWLPNKFPPAQADILQL